MRIFCLTILMVTWSALCVNAQTNKTPSPAQTAPERGTAAPVVKTDGAKSNPQKEADIRKLLDLTGTTTLMEQTMQDMEKTLRPLMANSLPPGEYREKLLDLFFERFHSQTNLRQFLDLAVPIYDKYFTDEDIKGLIQFYQTPLGQKTVKTLPQLMSELTQAGQKMGEEIGRRSMLEVMAEHPELEKAMEDAQKGNQP